MFALHSISVHAFAASSCLLWRASAAMHYALNDRSSNFALYVLIMHAKCRRSIDVKSLDIPGGLRVRYRRAAPHTPPSQPPPHCRTRPAGGMHPWPLHIIAGGLAGATSSGPAPVHPPVGGARRCVAPQWTMMVVVDVVLLSPRSFHARSLGGEAGRNTPAVVMASLAPRTGHSTRCRRPVLRGGHELPPTGASASNRLRAPGPSRNPRLLLTAFPSPSHPPPIVFTVCAAAHAYAHLLAHGAAAAP